MDNGSGVPKAVLDSNVLVSAFITEGDSYEILKLVQAGKFTLYLAPGIPEEVRRVLLEYEHIRSDVE